MEAPQTLVGFRIFPVISFWKSEFPTSYPELDGLARYVSPEDYALSVQRLNDSLIEPPMCRYLRWAAGLSLIGSIIMMVWAPTAGINSKGVDGLALTLGMSLGVALMFVACCTWVASRCVSNPRSRYENLHRAVDEENRRFAGVCTWQIVSTNQVYPEQGLFSNTPQVQTCIEVQLHAPNPRYTSDYVPPSASQLTMSGPDLEKARLLPVATNSAYYAPTAPEASGRPQPSAPQMPYQHSGYVLPGDKAPAGTQYGTYMTPAPGGPPVPVMPAAAAMPAVVFCTSCGRRLPEDEGVRFCAFCGTPRMAAVP